MKKLITLILMLLCIASLSSCSNSKPELLNYYDKQSVRVRLSNEKEAIYKEVEEDRVEDEILTNDQGEEVCIIKIYKESKLVHQEEFSTDYLMECGSYIFKGDAVFIGAEIKRGTNQYSNVVYKYENDKFEIYQQLDNTQYSYSDNIIMFGEYIYSMIDYYENKVQTDKIAVYDYEGNHIDTLVFHDIKVRDIIKTNKGYTMLCWRWNGETFDGTRVYTYNDNELILKDDLDLQVIHDINYDKDTDTLTFMGRTEVMQKVGYYTSYKNVAFYRYNNGDLEKIIEVDFPSDYYYSPNALLVMENNVILVIKVTKFATMSYWSRIIILNYDYENTKCIYIDDTYHDTTTRDDYIYLCKERFNIFSKEENNKYRKISVEDIIK